MDYRSSAVEKAATIRRLWVDKGYIESCEPNKFIASISDRGLGLTAPGKVYSQKWDALGSLTYMSRVHFTAKKLSTHHHQQSIYNPVTG